jgi:hypothetical protein
MPLQGLAQATGRPYSPDELTRKCSQAVFPRTTQRSGGVTGQSDHFYVEAGLPKPQVLLGVYGEQWRAVGDTGVFAAYHCRYDWRERTVPDVREGVFSPTRFASAQRSLIPFNAQDSVVFYRPQPLRRSARLAFPAQQLMLFAFIPTG